MSINSGFSLISQKLCYLQIYIIRKVLVQPSCLCVLHKNPCRNKGAIASQRLKFLYSVLPVLFDSLFTLTLLNIHVI